MFAQESVMDIQRQAFQEWYIANHHDGDIHPNQQLLEWSEKGGFYFASSVEDLWEAWQAAKAQAVPEGFVLIKDDTKTVVAIERMVEQQVEASGMDSRRLERLDGWKIIEAAVKAQEPTND